MNRLIVSFTSFPARIDSVKTVLDSLYRQTLQADEIILWLAEEQFPNKEADLPLSLQEDLAAKRFTLRWCDDLGSHKKYFYAMQEYPEDIIVTVDDELYYHPDSLEKLMEAHKRYPNAVAALAAYLALPDEELQPLPIISWPFDFQHMLAPSMLLIAGSGGGTLFPPHAIDQRIFDKQLIYDTCSGFGRIYADDILLKAGCMLKHTPVLAVPGKPYYRLPNTQHVALAGITPGQKHNDMAIERIKERFRDEFNIDECLRLREAFADFQQLDQHGAIIRKHWLERPSRDLERQIGYLSLPHAPPKPDAAGYREIKGTATIAAKIFTAFPAESSDDEAAKAVHAFQQRLLDVPDIDRLAESDAVVCGFVKYGVPLLMECPIIYRGAPVYMRGLKNWQSFMEAHPDCEPVFRKGYNTFLKNSAFQIGKARAVLSNAEIVEWMLEYEKAITKYTNLKDKGKSS